MTMPSIVKTLLNRALPLAAIMSAIACNNDSGLLPISGGKPYEVVVAGTVSDATEVVAEILSSLTVEDLPQPEPAFDLSSTTNPTGQATKYARSIVIVNTNPNMADTIRMSYKRNVYARPQIIISIWVPSAERLAKDMPKHLKDINYRLNRFELNAGIASMKRRRNRKAEKIIKQLFRGTEIWIPEELTAMKRGKDFIWISDNATSGTRNICVYTYSANDFPTPEEAMNKRDSMMRKNIPGEAPQMFMTTERHAGPTFRTTNRRGRKTMEMRGLWTMNGDAMGGPFMSYSIIDSAR